MESRACADELFPMVTEEVVHCLYKVAVPLCFSITRKCDGNLK